MEWTARKSSDTENWIVQEGNKVIAVVLARDEAQQIAEEIVQRHNKGLAEPDNVEVK